jgi:putative hydrolase of the HAD superfamily
MAIELVGLDADDTLWHNESYFRLTHQRFNDLLGPYADPATLDRRLVETMERNVRTYGYGAKTATLSMIETASEVAGQDLHAVIGEILAAGRELMAHPVELLPGVREAVEQLAERYRLVLVTKGDLFHQELKLAGSGLGDHFSGVEIVSTKTADTYRKVFRRYGVAPEATVMAGNSVRSDVLPALEAGAFAAHIPYELVWEHEAADLPENHPRLAQLNSISELPRWLEEHAAR